MMSSIPFPSINHLRQFREEELQFQATQSIMCRGFRVNESEVLKIRAFCTYLSLSRARIASDPPDFLTLHFLPRINGGLLAINGSDIRSDSPAFVTLHRAVSEEVGRGFEYASRERVNVCEGARFEIYVGDARALKGIFRKGEGHNWKMECKCVLSANGVVRGVKDAEVAVAAEGLGDVLSEKVVMVAAARRRRCSEMEEIPEVREEESVCCCSECGAGGGEAEDCGDCEVEVDVEAVRWAVDFGIWVVCVGVGCLVSASSFKRLRRKKF